MLQNSEWYVNTHKIWWDNYSNSYVAMLILTDPDKLDWKNGPNVKIKFKTRCAICTNPDMNLEGCVVSINDVWFSHESSLVCLKNKGEDGKYKYENAYIDVICFNDIKVLKATYAAQTTAPTTAQTAAQTTAPTTAQTTAPTTETVGFDWDEDLNND